MKKILALLLCSAMIIGSSTTVLAAPKTMPDGQTFDAEYYASTYPDVKVAFGNDEAALYNHYVQYGKAEGRNPVKPGNNATVTISANTPKCAQDMFNALNSQDYDKIKSYAKNYTKYAADLAPFLWEQTEDSRSYYYVPCEGGNLTLYVNTYGGETWLYMGIGKQDIKKAQETSQKEYEQDIRFYSSKMNYDQTMLDYLNQHGANVYPKECFMKGDTWIKYTKATNGYKDYQIYADGKVVYGDTDDICPSGVYF